MEPNQTANKQQETSVPEAPTPQVPPVMPPHPDAVTPKKVIPSWIKLTLAGLGILILIVAVSMIAKPKTPAISVIQPTPTTFLQPTVPPIRPIAAVASTSAFTNLEQGIANLKTTIAGYNPSDPILSPPTLELSLGF